MDRIRNNIGLAAVAGAALGAASIATGNYFVDVAFGREKRGILKKMFQPQTEGVPPFPIPDEAVRMQVERNASDLMRQVEAWKSEAAIERVVRTVDDGATKLVGYLYYNARPTRRWVVLVHGYRGRHADMEACAKLYADEDFNVLIPDLRAHGESDGEVIGMGWADADDVLGWADYLVQRFGSSIGVVLHGHSMGAATVLAASGRCTIPQIGAIVADSGYTSVWDCLACQLHTFFHLPAHPLLDIANLCFVARGGFDFHGASMMDAVRTSSIPTLIIHGAQDRFIPPAMAPQLYGECGAQRKELRIVADAGHTMALLIDPAAYRDLVKNFITEANR